MLVTIINSLLLPRSIPVFSVDMSKILTTKQHGAVVFPYEGELGAERLMELLAASFDWDASLRDPSAALAYLGRKPEEKLDYEELVGGFGGLVGGWDGSFLELVRWGGNGESS